LIPVFVVQYFKAQEPKEYMQAAAIVLASGLTDFLDGFIARTFNMVTEFGKLIDPMADKLTQAALLFVLIVKIKYMFLLLILFVVIQLAMLAAGLAMLKKGRRLDGSKWFGKVSTTVFYAIMLVLVALPKLSQSTLNILMLICGVFFVLSFVLYVREYIRMYRGVKQEERAK
jgi:cardiolipin synthase